MLWAIPTALPQIKLPDHKNTVDSTKSLWIPRFYRCVPRDKLGALKCEV
jgi:hypothetical protein